MAPARGAADTGAAAVESLRALRSYHHSNVAWLDLGTAERIESVISELEDLAREFGEPGLTAVLTTLDPAADSQHERTSLPHLGA